MSAWLDKITADPDDLTPVLAAYEHYRAEYESFRQEIDDNRLKGRRVIEVGGRIPGLSEHVYAQWSHIKAIVEVLELRLLAATQKARKFYVDGYPAKLGAHQVESFAKADPHVLAVSELLIRMNLVKDLWEGVSKGAERLHYQIGNIVEMRRGGLEDATL